MVFCLQADLVFSTATRRDDVLADMQSQVQTRERWGETTVTGYTTTAIHPLGAGRPALTVTTRFTAKADLDSVMARLENFATGPRAPVAGSWYDLHDCTHDLAQPLQACTATRRTW